MVLSRSMGSAHGQLFCTLTQRTETEFWPADFPSRLKFCADCSSVMCLLSDNTGGFFWKAECFLWSLLSYLRSRSIWCHHSWPFFFFSPVILKYFLCFMYLAPAYFKQDSLNTFNFNSCFLHLTFDLLLHITSYLVLNVLGYIPPCDLYFTEVRVGMNLSTFLFLAVLVSLSK